MKTAPTANPSAACIELDETALSMVVGGDDPHWADVDDEGFFGFEITFVHEIDCADDSCDNVG